MNKENEDPNDDTDGTIDDDSSQDDDDGDDSDTVDGDKPKESGNKGGDKEKDKDSDDGKDDDASDDNTSYDFDDDKNDDHDGGGGGDKNETDGADKEADPSYPIVDTEERQPSDYDYEWEQPAKSGYSIKYILIFSITCFLLALSVSIYLVLGAIYFMPLEASAESQSLRSLTQVREGLFGKLRLKQKDQTKEDWLPAASAEMAVYEERLLRVYRKRLGGAEANIDVKTWTMSGAVIFCGSVITTIGWGNITPKTYTGQLSCIIYAIFGIPLLFSLTAITSAIVNIFVRGIWSRTKDFLTCGKK